MEDIKINVPEGYEIDKEKSVIDFEKNIVDIKLKKKIEKWRDDEQNVMRGYYIGKSADIIKVSNYINNTPHNYNTFATEKQAKSALAMARISQIMANDGRFGGIITDEEWVNNSAKYVLQKYQGKIYKWTYSDTYEFLAFHTKEQRDLFLEENEDLVKDYLMID
jgi:hypothetical protein